MKRVLIAGIGNVLLGDDGVGPYVISILESSYAFEEGVRLEDLGTPSLDFIDHIVGLDALIVIDSVDNDEQPGTITHYRKQDFALRSPSLRMDTHSPAITESLAAAEVFYGISPAEIFLIGVSPESYDAGCTLSEPVKAAVEPTVQAVLTELDRLGVTYQKKAKSGATMWWSAVPRPA